MAKISNQNIPAAENRPCRRWTWILLAILLTLTAAARWHRLEVPMERDEGEYAYAGQLILQGVAPYGENAACNMKLPGIYLTYALIMLIFGQTLWGVHLGLLLVNLASIVLIHRIGRRLIDDTGALCAAAAFALLSIHQSVSGLFANAEHFVILPALGGMLMLLKAPREECGWRWAICGLLMGIGFVIKQHGVMFIGFAGLLIVAETWFSSPRDGRQLLRRLALFGGGALTPFLLICLWMLAAGVFERFWFWTFTYAAQYVSQTSWRNGMILLNFQLGLMGGSLWGFWLLAAAGLAAVAIEPALRRRWVFWLGLPLCSLAATSTGLLFRNHYFLFLMPAASLLIGAATFLLTRGATRMFGGRGGLIASGAVFSAAFFAGVAGQWDMFTRFSNDHASRKIYGANPFPESVRIAEYLRRNTSPQDTIAIVGSEPQIYFYSRRRAATSHIYTYALMEGHPFALQMQQEMIAQIEKARPRYLVYVNIYTSWLARPDSNMHLLDWFGKYSAAGYERIGLIDIGERTEYFWDQNVIGRQPRDPNGHWIGVYRRKDGASG